MEESFSIWVKSSSGDLNSVKNEIEVFAKLENKDSFDAHVTLVSNIKSLNKAEELLDKIKKEKITVEFDEVRSGDSFFQRLFLTASDSDPFNKAIENIEGWPSLWVPHLSLYYGNELPKSYPSKDLDNLIPITITFDTLELLKTGPIVAEWKEITTLFLN